MDNLRKLIKISEENSICIISIDEKLNEVKYKNLGEKYDSKFVHTDNFRINETKGMFEILSEQGNAKTWFPVQWLDPIQGMIAELIERKILK